MFLIQQTRHPCPEASQGGVCEIAMTRPTSVLTAGVRLILGCLVVGTLAGFSQSRHVAAPPLGYVLGVAFPIRPLPVTELHVLCLRGTVNPATRPCVFAVRSVSNKRLLTSLVCLQQWRERGHHH